MKKILISVAVFLLASFPASAQLTNPTVSGPTSSTVNAFSLWGDTTGDALVNTPLLLDTSPMVSGNKATFQVYGNNTPGLGATYIFPPPNSGTSAQVFLNGVFNTLSSNFVAESNQWFNSTDSSKRMTFSLAGEKAGDTVVIELPADFNTTSGTRSISFPVFPNGTTGYTLLTNAGANSVSNWLIGGSAISDTLLFDDQIGNYPVRPTFNGNGLKIYDWVENFDFTNADGETGMHITGFTNVELDFGTTPLSEKTFTVTDSQLKATNNYQGFDYYVEAYIPRHTSTGKTAYIDEGDMDTLDVRCTPGSGNMTCFVRCLTGQFRGTFQLNYRLVQLNFN